MFSVFGCNSNKSDYLYVDHTIDSIIKKSSIPMIQGAYFNNSDRHLFEANSGNYTPPAISHETVFQAASLSKTLFSYIVMKMVSRGEIDLDAPLSGYLDFYRINESQKPWSGKLTARIILSHRSGLPNWSISPSSDQWSLSQLDFRFKPDSTFGYSGEAYYYLQQVIEKISNKPLQKLASEEVFIPLGMNSSSYEWGRTDIPSLQYDSIAADGFNKEGINLGKGKHPRANCAYTLRTTAKDYSVFLEAVFSKNNSDKAIMNEMLNPVTSAQRYIEKKRECDKTIFWGLGIGIEENEELGRIFFHWGDNGNFKALFVVVPSLGKHLVYFTNSAHGHSIIDNIVPLFFNNTKPLGLSAWINETV